MFLNIYLNSYADSIIITGFSVSSLSFNYILNFLAALEISFTYAANLPL